MNAFRDFIDGVKRGYRRSQYRWYRQMTDDEYIGYWFRTRRSALEWAIQCQILHLEDEGITSDFQAGYAEALCHSWLAAGYPEMPAVETARRLVRAHIVQQSEGAAR